MTLRIETTETIVAGALAVDPMWADNGNFVTFTQDLISRLPH